VRFCSESKFSFRNMFCNTRARIVRSGTLFGQLQRRSLSDQAPTPKTKTVILGTGKRNENFCIDCIHRPFLYAPLLETAAAVLYSIACCISDLSVFFAHMPGWVGFSLARRLDKRKHDVYIVSPRNHYLFTPLLPSTTVGTLEYRAIQGKVMELLNHC
jgi:hypothetical protein